MSAKKLLNEAYNEMMKEFGDAMNPTEGDVRLGEASAKLAQAKGELATILDRANREGIIKRTEGKVKIMQKEEWVKRVGDLPKQIQELQKQLTPDPNVNLNNGIS